ncbi:MAG TPA: hypothetical protein VFE16_01380 [Candidatus Cybelea sp.]|jgi:hypothetical protein|nr:hypothetical protein [Candidatus Cybelea sp.]
MSWTVGRGQDGGDTVVVMIDDEFRNVAQRGKRDTRVSVRFLGSYMLMTAANRNAFEKQLVPALQAHGGVLVAGITRTNPVSYTFLGYCIEDIEPAAIPVDDALRSSCTVSVYHDPQWTEYESWLPEEPSGVNRIAVTLRSLLYKLYIRR